MAKAATTTAAGATKFESAADRAAKSAAQMARALADGSSSTQASARSFEELRRAVDPAYDASRRLAEIQREVAATAEREGISQRAVNIVLEQAASRYMGVATAAERAAQAQREQAQAVASATGGYQSLRASIDPVYAASKRYETAVEQLDAALGESVISQREHARMMELAGKHYLTTGNAAQAYGGQIQSASGHTATLAAQFNDIGVMLAAGQSPLQLAMQQGTQINQVFAQLGGGKGAIRALGAAFMSLLSPLSLATLGIIAGGAALIQWGMSAVTAGKDSRTLEDVVSDLSATTGSYRDAVESARMSLVDMSDEFGAGAARAKLLYQSMLSLRELEVASAIKKSFSAVSKEFRDLGEVVRNLDLAINTAGLSIKDGGLGGADKFISRLKDEFGLTVEQARLLNDQFREFKDAKGLEDQTREAGELVDLVRDLNDEGAKLPDGFIEATLALGDTGIEALRLLGLMDDTGASTRDAASAAGGLSGSLANATGVAAQLVSVLGQVPGAIAAMAGNFENALNSLSRQSASLQYQVDQGISATIADLKVQRDEIVQAAADMLGAAASPDMLAKVAAPLEKQIEKAKEYQASIDANRKTLSDQAKAAADAANAGAEGGRKSAESSRAAANATKDLLAELNKELDAREELIGLSDEEREKKEALQQVYQKLGDDVDKYTQADIQATADRIAAIDENEERWQEFQSTVDDVANGIVDSFFDSSKSILGTFKDLIKTLIKQALLNPIRVMIQPVVGAVQGMFGGGIPGMGGAGSLLGGGDALTMALRAAGAPVGGGILGSISTGIGALTGGFGAGLSGVVGGFASGGFGGAWAGGAAAIKGATGALGTFGAALGAIAAPLAIAGALISGFIGKTKELDRGLKISVGNIDALVKSNEAQIASNEGLTKIFPMFGKRLANTAVSAEDLAEATVKVDDNFGVLVESFQRTEKSRFWGLSKSRSTKTSPVDAKTADPIVREVARIHASVLDAADALGFGADTFKGFAHTLKISTKDLSESEIAQAVSDALGGLASEMAGMIPGIKNYALENEGAADTLNRLVTSVQGVNAMLDQLGLGLYQTTLAGADMASGLVDLFGGLEQFGTATGFYYQNFYSEAERLGRLAGMTAAEFDKLGIAMPTSTESMRALVDGIDLTTASGQELFATLMMLAPAVSSLIGVERQRADLLFSLMSEEEQAAARSRELAKAFADLGLAMPTTKDGFRNLIEGIDTTTGSGQELVATLIQIAPAVQELITAEEQRAEQLKLLAEEQRAAAEQLAAEQIALAQKRTDLLFSLMSEEEQAAARNRDLAKTFADLGLAMPKTREGFAKIISGLDLTSEAGIRAFGLLSGAAKDFLSSVEAQKITGAGPAAPSASSGGSSRPSRLLKKSALGPVRGT